MTAFSTATILAFTSLGLVALALGLLVRRYSGSALATGLAGLLALTTALTWITYVGPGSRAQVMNNNLKPEVAAGKELQVSREQVQELEKQVASSNAESDRIRTTLATAQGRLGEAQQETAKARAESGRLTEALQAEQHRLEAEQHKLADAKTNEADAIAKVAELEKKVAELKKELREAIPHVTPSPPKPNLRQMLDNRLETPFYTSRPLEQRTLVAGLTGSWYAMRLNLRDKPFVFADGKFRAPEAAQQVAESVLELQNRVLAPVKQEARNMRLFLRGGADTRRLRGATEVPDARELVILPRLRDENYAADPRRLFPAAPVRNEDLPNLRADWLREHIRPLLRSLESTDIGILENRPAPDEERTVDLILYVEW